jgi:hypothetical protein
VSLLALQALFKQGRMAEAADEQAWKLAVLSVFGVYGGNAERAVFKPLIGVDLVLSSRLALRCVKFAV